MCDRLISFFASRHILCNLIFALVIFGGIASWYKTNKEELPDVNFDTVRISVVYRGATAEDVEYFVTRPIEEAVREIDGVFRISSTSSQARANVRVELERDYPNYQEAIMEIRAAVLDIDLPEEVTEQPTVRVFKTSKKAILDVALYHRDRSLLDVAARAELQRYAFALENQLLNLREVHSVSRRGYLQEEILVKLKPAEMSKHKIAFNSVIRELQNNNIRQPAGTLESTDKPKVTLLSELDTPEKIRKVAVQGGFRGRVVRLEEVAEVERAFDDSEAIHKVNGRESVMFNIVKSSSEGILSALDSVVELSERFRSSTLKDTSIELVLLDDESVDVRNRLDIISLNGGIGFLLILAILFVFLDWRSGFWVAMGVPFTLCFAMIVASFLGFTVNGTTLSAVIIVMGIVVDDAIIVAENITRLAQSGVARMEAVVKGVSFVLGPIFTSIITTCAAFVPLLYFEGHFGAFLKFIPPIIFAMLAASFLESVFILPAHMGFMATGGKERKAEGHWFTKVERLYQFALGYLLRFRAVLIAVFVVLLALSWKLVNEEMKFVMFPNEETRDLVLVGETEVGSTKYQTARKVEEIEQIILPYLGKEVVGFRTEIARSRRGGLASENSFRTIVEIVAREKRDKTADQIVDEIKTQIDSLQGFYKIRFAKTRWGQESGSPIELIVQENDDDVRRELVAALSSALEEREAISKVEVDRDYHVPEYRISIDRDTVKRLGIDPRDLVSTFRAALEGKVLYEFSNGSEDINVRLTTVDSAKRDIASVLKIPVENKNNYLVTLDSLVELEKISSPESISRRDLKRSTFIDADIAEGAEVTPLEVARELEQEVFPELYSRFPTSSIRFEGEVRHSRESEKDFRYAVIIALFIIYVILAVFFNSLIKPFVIMSAIPFALVGVVLAFYVHGKLVYGFYACVGALGLAGVVINDGIIMIAKLDSVFDEDGNFSDIFTQIAQIASSRLRAVLLTTVTTVAGLLPTAYGLAGFDATLSEMMLALTWGMIFGTAITLVLIPTLYSYGKSLELFYKGR